MRLTYPLVLAALASLAMTAPARSDQITGIDWQLSAVDGVPVDYDATLRLEDGGLMGMAPCNGFRARNRAALPELAIEGILSTKRACDRLDDEQRYLRKLQRMTGVRLDGPATMILTGPDGQQMAFTSAPAGDTAPPEAED